MMDTKAKILLVEDDLFLRDIYKETMVSAGFDITTASDGREALEKIKQGGWDLVLLDVVLPGMSGVEIMDQVKTFLKKPAKHIVFLTNSDDTGDLEHVLGFTDGYLLKSSFTPLELIEKVKTYIS
jgi:CheY-like chemotaxis protein